VWNAKTGKPILNLLHNGWVRSACYNRDETRILTACDDRHARVWNAKTGNSILNLLHNGWVRSACYNNDATHILTASDDKTARVWNATTGQLMLMLVHDDLVRSACYNNDETNIITCSNKQISIWEQYFPSLMQAQLCSLLFTWLCVKKYPKGTDTIDKYLSEIVKATSSEHYYNESMLYSVWHSFPAGIQEQLWKKIKISVIMHKKFL
jgi:WD40 repeat protein